MDTDDDDDGNGKTPSTANKHDKKRIKRTKYDEQRELNDSFNSVDDVKEELERERQINKDLTFRIGKMQGQLDDLSRQIEKLTDIMVNLQKEKDELKIEMMQKKSPAKKVNKVKKHKKKTTPVFTQLSSEQNIHATNNVNNDEKQDNDNASVSTAHDQNTNTNAQQSGANDEQMIVGHTNKRSIVLSEDDDDVNSDSDEVKVRM